MGEVRERPGTPGFEGAQQIIVAAGLELDRVSYHFIIRNGRTQ
jgi:hypothetical protein